MKKNVVITGASGGIGRALAEAFAKEGYCLALNCHNSIKELNIFCSELKEKYGVFCQAFQEDIGNPGLVEEMFYGIYEQFSSIDVLINNAGISHFGLLNQMTVEEWRNVMSTNLDSLFYCSKAVIPDMVRRKQGRILNICSVWGERGASYEVAYSASKGGMIAFTKALAKELAPSEIPVNAIAPGMVDTPMNHKNLSTEDLEALKEELPMGRFAEPEEIARTALLLAEAPTYLTGQILGVNGGWF